MKIQELRLYTRNLSKQTTFYADSLGLQVVESSNTFSVFQIGKTRLILEQNENSTPYHFAINISCNKENEALVWLKQRVDILTYNGNEIQDFFNWNAKAIYFYDKDKNIVEFIARKNLNNGSKGEFNANDLLEISEIGLPVNKIESSYQTLRNTVPLQIFDGGFEKFCAIGDEHGLFICINKNEKDWFPTGDKAYSSDFEVRFFEQSKEYSVKFKDGAINII